MCNAPLSLGFCHTAQYEFGGSDPHIENFQELLLAWLGGDGAPHLLRHVFSFLPLIRGNHAWRSCWVAPFEPKGQELFEIPLGSGV